MAFYSTGITATWNGYTFLELVSLDISWSGPREDRSSASSSGWIAQGGKVTLVSYVLAASLADYGKIGTLTLSGGGMNYSGPAMMDGISVTPELNGVTRYSVTLSTID